MLVGHRTKVDPQEAVIEARRAYQAARDAMIAAINKDYMTTARIIDGLAQASQVFPQFACPDCGNRDMGSLIFGVGIRIWRVTCHQCGCGYTID